MLTVGVGVGPTFSQNKIFSPLDIPDLALWLDADDDSTILDVAGAVGTWNDKSGNSNNAGQSDPGSKPTTDAETINGRNVLVFDGNDQMQIAHDVAFNMQSQASIFVVTSTAEILSNSVLLDKQGVWAFGQAAAKARFTTLGILDYDTTADFFAVDTPVIATYIFDDSDDVQFIKNGVAFETVAGGSPPNTNTNNLFLGGSAIGWTGVIGELLYFNRQLNASEKILVGNYLAGKWGIS